MDPRELSRQLKHALGSTAEETRVFGTILELLAGGEPVAKSAIARELRVSDERAATLLSRVPNLELDDRGDVIGAGLSLRPTEHVFEIDGKKLYAWCALDTLIFPHLLGRTASVTSPCAGTGAPVRLVVGTEALYEFEPPGAVVSLLLPGTGRDVRNSFCRHVHFFASEEAAAPWLQAHPTGWVLGVRQAHALARDLAHRLREGAGVACC